MNRFLQSIKKNKGKVILSVFLLFFLIGGLFIFRLLVKVGNIKYLYNYMVKTEGSLPPVTNLENSIGASAKKASPDNSTKPQNLQIITRLQIDNTDKSSYSRKEPIFFSNEIMNNITSLEGITTFRGDYMRNLQAYGTTILQNKKFSRDYWSFKTGKVLKGNGVDYWSGNGWTGQPLAVRWNAKQKRIMNLYESAKNKDQLIEVIYPGMDGYIHFLDMETGAPTRDAINAGMTFKGTASIHPGGVPLLVCGSGDAQTGIYGECISPRVMIFSLLDGKKLYEFGANDPMAPRIWHAYDSSPIFHEETDTLIYPGENGVLYTLKLNTKYNQTAGTLSIQPSELVRFTYSAARSSEDMYTWGSESSASVWENYLFLGDNAGIVTCIDLNTMNIIWAQDVYDDVNSSIIFEEDEQGNKYLYVATTLKYQTNSHYMGEANIFKLNAMNGKIIWRKPYEVHTVKGLAGGFLSTGVLGKGVISDKIYYSVSKTPGIDSGYLAALDKKTGEVVWEKELAMYSWSSSGMIYTNDDKPYLVQGCQNGDLLLIDAITGETMDKMNFGTGIEATPAIFGNRLVVGTRNEQIIGLEFK